MTEWPAAFYVADGDGWQSTVITPGPWDAGFQHAGPPAALIGRAIEGLIHDTDLRVARISFNLRRPVPVALLRIEAELQPGGRRVRYARARLLDSEGRLLIEAEALLMRSAPVTMPARPAALPPFDGAMRLLTSPAAPAVAVRGIPVSVLHHRAGLSHRHGTAAGRRGVW